MNASKANSVFDDSNLDKSVFNNEENEQDDIVKSRKIRVNLNFDGFTYKMRVRKEESIVKVIDFSLDFVDQMHSKKPSERDLTCELTDFQVLHQNNELIFKHSFGCSEFA